MRDEHLECDGNFWGCMPTVEDLDEPDYNEDDSADWWKEQDRKYETQNLQNKQDAFWSNFRESIKKVTL